MMIGTQLDGPLNTIATHVMELSSVSKIVLCIFVASLLFTVGRLVRHMGRLLVPRTSSGRTTSARDAPHHEPGAHTKPKDESQKSRDAKKGSVSLKTLNQMSKKAKRADEKRPESDMFIASLRHGDAVTGLAWSQDGKALATACADRELRIFSIDNVNLYEKKPPCQTFPMRTAVEDVVFGPTTPVRHGGRGHQYGTIAMLTKGPKAVPELHVVDTSGKDVTTVAIESNIFAPKSIAQTLCLKASRGSAATGNAPVVMAVAKGVPRASVFLASGEHIKPITTYDTGGMENYDGAVSDDGRFVAVATFASDVKVYALSFDRSGQVDGCTKVMDLAGHRRKVTAIAFSPDGNKVVTSSEDGTMRIWDINVRYKLNEDPKTVLTCGNPDVNTRVSHLSWGRGGYIAASCGINLYFINSNSGHVEEAVYGAHSGQISDVVWCPSRSVSPQGPITLVATSSDDGMVRLWRGPWGHSS